MTTSITITQNGASRIIVALHPVEAIPGLHHLKLSSLWSGAKSPEALNSQISLCPNVNDLRVLHAWLGTYLEVNA